MKFRIIPNPPFLITKHYELLGIEKLPIPCIYENRSVRRLFSIEGKEAPVKVNFVSEGKKPELLIEVFDDHEKKIKKMIIKIFRTKFDYSKFLNRIKRYKELYRIAKRLEGIRPPRFLSLYEALVDTVIEQNINYKFSLVMKSKFVKSFGKKVVINREEFYGFPEKELIAKKSPGEIKRKVKLSKMKSETIVRVANLDLPSVNWVEKHPNKFFDFITEVRGIGRWTAELTMAKISKNFYVGPVSDLSVRRGFKRIFGFESVEEIEKILSKLKDYSGLILYLMAFEGQYKIYKFLLLSNYYEIRNIRGSTRSRSNRYS